MRCIVGFGDRVKASQIIADGPATHNGELALGKNVLVSNLGEIYRLAAYLFRYTQQPIVVVMGIPTLAEIFNEKYYEDLAGGILEILEDGKIIDDEHRVTSGENVTRYDLKRKRKLHA